MTHRPPAPARIGAPSRRAGSRPGRRLGTLATLGGRSVALGLGVGLVLGLGGCGLRLATPPPAVPSAGSAEVARAAAVEHATRLAALAEAALASEGDPPDDVVAGILAAIESDSRDHLRALGGEWTPPAWATATATATATADASAVPGEGAASIAPASAADVLGELGESGSRTCADAVAVEPADLATLLGSICLAEAAMAQDLADALGEPVPSDGSSSASASATASATASASASGTSSAPVADPGAFGAALGDALAVESAAPLARALDAAGFALEAAAARSTGPARTDLAARAAAHRAVATAVLTGAGLTGGVDDPRRAAYDLGDLVGRASGGGTDTQTGPGAVVDPTSLAAVVETDVLAAWTAVFGPATPDLRPGVLTAMSESQRAAHTWGAERVPFPGLPAPQP